MRAPTYDTFGALFTWTESLAQKAQPREYLETRNIDDTGVLFSPRPIHEGCPALRITMPLLRRSGNPEFGSGML